MRAMLGAWRLWRGFAAVAVLGLTCAGCASSTVATGPARLSDGAVDTGTYPNLNVPPPVATKAFDPESLEAHNQAIAQARSAQEREGQNAARLAAQGQAEQARLRKLAAAQQAETLRAIAATSN